MCEVDNDFFFSPLFYYILDAEFIVKIIWMQDQPFTIGAWVMHQTVTSASRLKSPDISVVTINK